MVSHLMGRSPRHALSLLGTMIEKQHLCQLKKPILIQHQTYSIGKLRPTSMSYHLPHMAIYSLLSMSMVLSLTEMHRGRDSASFSPSAIIHLSLNFLGPDPVSCFEVPIWSTIPRLTTGRSHRSNRWRTLVPTAWEPRVVKTMVYMYWGTDGVNPLGQLRKGQSLSTKSSSPSNLESQFLIPPLRTYPADVWPLLSFAFR